MIDAFSVFQEDPTIMMLGIVLKILTVNAERKGNLNMTTRNRKKKAGCCVGYYQEPPTCTCYVPKHQKEETMKKPRVVKAWAYYEDGKIQKCQNGLGTTLCIHKPRPRLQDGKIVKEFVEIEIRPLKSRRRGR